MKGCRKAFKGAQAVTISPRWSIAAQTGQSAIDRAHI
jgi:hypothetical protein